MPRDPAGNFSLFPNYVATPGTTILAEQHNAPLEDVAQALTQSLARDGRGGMVGPLDMGGFRVTNVGEGIAPNDVATVGLLSGLVGFPVGAVVDFAGPIAPTAWMLCYGQAVSRTTYAALFAVIGTRYGGGDGSSTFNLPDLRGYGVAGKDDMGGSDAGRLSSLGAAARTLGGTGGTQEHTLTAAQVPAHTHTVSGTTSTTGSHTHTVDGPSVGTTGSRYVTQIETGNGTVNTAKSTSSAGEHNHTFSGTTSSAFTGGPHPHIQPTFILNKIIKVVA